MKGITIDEEDEDNEDLTAFFFEKEEKIVSQAPHNLNWRDDINSYSKDQNAEGVLTLFIGLIL